MISLPPGFDASLFVSDLLGISAAIVPVIVLFGAFYLIRRIIRGL